MSGWLHSGPIPQPWPPDLYQVTITRPAPDFTTVDGYHYAEFARDAAIHVTEAGLAIQVKVIRLADGMVLFDLQSGVSIPAESW